MNARERKRFEAARLALQDVVERWVRLGADPEVVLREVSATLRFMADRERER